MWNTNSTALLKLRKSDFCPEEVERKTMSFCEFEETQNIGCGWLSQQPSKHFVRCSTTLGGDIPLLQTRLLPDIPQLADGGQTVSGNARNYFRQQIFRLKKPSPAEGEMVLPKPSPNLNRKWHLSTMSFK